MPDDDTDEKSLEDALVRVSFRVMAVLTRIASEHDLSLTQLRLLGILRDRRPRMSDLARFLGLDKSTMSGLVERAERRDLVARGRAQEDGRAIEVFITPTGRELGEQLRDEIRSALAPMVTALADGDRDDAKGLLDVLGDVTEVS